MRPGSRPSPKTPPADAWACLSSAIRVTGLRPNVNPESVGRIDAHSYDSQPPSRLLNQPHEASLSPTSLRFTDSGLPLPLQAWTPSPQDRLSNRSGTVASRAPTWVVSPLAGSRFLAHSLTTWPS